MIRKKIALTTAAVALLAASGANAEFIYRNPHPFNIMVSGGGGGVDNTASFPAIIAAASLNVAAGGSISWPISASLADNDGSETLSIRVTGLPTGATLSAGSADGPGAWLLSVGDLAGLSLSVPVDAAGSHPLVVTATTTESNGGAQASATASTALTVAWGGWTEMADTMDLNMIAAPYPTGLGNLRGGDDDVTLPTTAQRAVDIRLIASTGHQMVVDGGGGADIVRLATDYVKVTNVETVRAANNGVGTTLTATVSSGAMDIDLGDGNDTVHVAAGSTLKLANVETLVISEAPTGSRITLTAPLSAMTTVGATGALGPLTGIALVNQDYAPLDLYLSSGENHLGSIDNGTNPEMTIFGTSGAPDTLHIGQYLTSSMDFSTSSLRVVLRGGGDTVVIQQNARTSNLTNGSVEIVGAFGSPDTLRVMSAAGSKALKLSNFDPNGGDRIDLKSIYGSYAAFVAARTVTKPDAQTHVYSFGQTRLTLVTGAPNMTETAAWFGW